MTQTPPGPDPVYDALDELVRSGALNEAQAQAAYDASHGGAGSAPVAPARARRLTGPLQLDTLLVGLGSALVATTVVLSMFYARGGLAVAESMDPATSENNDLDWSNFSLGIVATLGLLGIAAAAWFLVRDPERRDNLFAWPGALGALGAGMMLGVGMDDAEATPYAVGALILVISATGFYLSRRGPFVLTAIVGLLFLYAKVFNEIFDLEDTDGDNFAMVIASAIFVFAVAVTIAGWNFSTRDLSGIVVGAIASYGLGLLLVVVSVMRILQGIFGGFSMEMAEPGMEAPKPDADTTYDNDVWVILIFAALLIALWAACWWFTGHVGYRVLILGTLTSVVPAATLALATEHPSWWGLCVGLVGGAVLVFVGLRSLGRSGEAPATPTVPTAPTT